MTLLFSLVSGPPKSNSEAQGQSLLRRVRDGDEAAFDELFRTYYPQLCKFATGYTNSRDLAREVVQNVFVKLWERRERIKVPRSQKAYLYGAVRNQALDHIKQARRRSKYMEKVQIERQIEEEIRRMNRSRGGAGHRELIRAVWEAVDELPDRRRRTFILHRQHGLSYAEIAEVMGVTRKTVENQMGRALKTLRQRLRNRLPFEQL